VEARLYDHLFSNPAPEDVPEGEDFRANLNPDSLEVLTDCRAEPSLGGAEPGTRVQLERMGYFCVDPDSTAERLVLNRTVTLRDTWAKIAKKAGA
jgi:glutaminyl-tRNA synthetase